MSHALDLKFFLARLQDNELDPTSIETSESLGRYVVARRDFSDLGTVIFREKPMVVHSDNDLRQLYDGYLNATDHTKQLILDMYTPPSNSALMLQAAMMSGLSALGYRRAAELGPQKMTKLAGASMTNSFAYYGRPLQYTEITQATTRKKAALLAYGSKLAHSCAPNTIQFSKTSDGYMHFKVIRPIKSGDSLSISYIRELFSSPTFARRDELWKSKSFVCRCPRCMGPDHCRVIRCPNKCKNHVHCFYDNVGSSDVFSAPDNNVDRWVCGKCGPLEPTLATEIVSTEAQVERTVSRIEMRTTSGMIESLFPKALKADLQVAKKELSSVHYLTQKLLLLTTKICASHAVGIEEASKSGMVPHNMMTPYGTSVQLRRHAAVAGFEFVASCECVAVGCSSINCSVGKRNHAPVMDCVENVLFAWQDLDHVPKRQWPNYVTPVYLEPYLSFLRISYGPTDCDVRDIETHVAKWKKDKYSKESFPEDVAAAGSEPIPRCDYCGKPEQAPKACKFPP
ncbi:expressed unknown protein [Seminavis robusta]|uniref:SET domain-containing protein n=1 Tax=Seminavis robusta TaxID=568900 RepID=A0A9N8DV48_9STRA|nr:expressed unknown protein [Seminavis robusta]|eukprot:Sro393_g133720.1 n/a (512) ;mRNA; r:60123-61800